MPVSLVERLPLPNLKTYTAVSAIMLSVSVYYAMNVTSDPEWRANMTTPNSEEETPPLILKLMQPLLSQQHDNVTRNYLEDSINIMTFMLQDPICMWSCVNAAWCACVTFAALVRGLVFGSLRASEAQRDKDRMFNYIFYKFIFVFGVLNVQFVDEVFVWVSWYCVVGNLHLFGQLATDRFEYMCVSSDAGGGGRSARGLALSVSMTALLSLGLIRIAALLTSPHHGHVFAFMAADCLLAALPALHVVTRYTLLKTGHEPASHTLYYTHLIFDCTSLLVEALHVLHMVVWSNMVVSMASVVLLMSLRHLLQTLHRRLQHHHLYKWLRNHMDRNYPMASVEEIESHGDNCAICWEPMKEARKLPCMHLFHNGCLCRWLQQDASCPTCRRPLSSRPPSTSVAPSAQLNTHTHNNNQLFHFDGPTPSTPPLPVLIAALLATAAALLIAGHKLFVLPWITTGSRYISWLPSFSVEVTRVAPLPVPDHSQIDAMARQVQALFPQYESGVLAADLALTRSADLTIDNILEGRLRQPRTIDNVHTREDSLNNLIIMNGETLNEEESRIVSTAPQTHHTDTSSNVEPIDGVFSKVSRERETMLARRKEMLLEEARRKYLKRTQKESEQANNPTPVNPQEDLS